VPQLKVTVIKDMETQEDMQKQKSQYMQECNYEKKICQIYLEPRKLWSSFSCNYFALPKFPFFSY